MSIAPVAVSQDNMYIITTDGKGVFCDKHGHAENFWHWNANERVNSVRIACGKLLVLDDAGRITWIRLEDGAPEAFLNTHRPLRGLAAEGSSWAAYDDKGVCAGDDERIYFEYDHASITCCELDYSVRYLAIGNSDGQVVRIDLKSENRIRTELPFAITGLAWFADGGWFASGEAIVRLNEDLSGGKVWRGMVADLAGVVTSRCGGYLATRYKDDMVFAHEIASSEGVWNTLHLPERTPGQLQFSVHGWLAIALGEGDGNKWETPTGQLHRTALPPGRERNMWTAGISKMQIEYDEEEEGSLGCGVLILLTLFLLMAGLIGGCLYYFLG